MLDDDEGQAWCRRCGSRQLEGGVCHCVIVSGTEPEVAALIEAARHDRRALRRLAGLSTPIARPLLEELVADEVDEKLATAAVSALSKIGAEESFDLMLSERVAALGEQHVVDYLRRRGGERARAALVSRLDGDRSVAAAYALAEMGDRRATPVLLAAVSAAPRWSRWYLAFDSGIPVDHPLAGLLRLRDPIAIGPLQQMVRHAAALEERTEELVAAHRPRPDRRAFFRQYAKDHDIPAEMLEPILEQSARMDAPESVRTRAASNARSALVDLVVALAALDPDGSRQLIEDAVEALDYDPRESLTRPNRTTFDAPLSRSTVAFEIDDSTGPADHPGTRFGGQPTWLAEPTWPLTSARTPMAFWGQLVSPSEPSRMVYLFVDPDDEPEEFDAAEVSVFAQPAGRPNVPFAVRATGPALSNAASWVTSRPRLDRADAQRVRVPRLEPFEEPVDWREVGLLTTGYETTNKLGGTPFWVRDPMDPPTGYEFVGQFTAERVGHAIGHVGTCYVFVHPETGDGWFRWQA